MLLCELPQLQLMVSHGFPYSLLDTMSSKVHTAQVGLEVKKCFCLDEFGESIWSERLLRVPEPQKPLPARRFPPGPQAAFLPAELYCGIHRITESLKLEKSSQSIKSNPNSSPP